MGEFLIEFVVSLAFALVEAIIRFAFFLLRITAWILSLIIPRHPAVRMLFVLLSIPIVAAFATGLVDRLLLHADPSGPRLYAAVPEKPERAQVVSLADLCVGFRRGTQNTPLAHILLPSLDEGGCQRALGFGMGFTTMLMLPAGSHMEVIHEEPSLAPSSNEAQIQDGTIAVYRYDAGERRPWAMVVLHEASATLSPHHSYCRPNSENGTPQSSWDRQPTPCKALFSFVDHLDEKPEQWTFLYKLSRAASSRVKMMMEEAHAPLEQNTLPYASTPHKGPP